jgi:uncharacterized protein YifN (PemK superfamily)
MTSPNPAITIRYFESFIVETNLLGSECYIGISEAFLPDLYNQTKSFLVKKFSSKENYNWIVKKISQHGNESELFFDILLEVNISNVPEVYLNQTIKKTNKKVSNVLYPGTLVEVDYGFTQSVIKDKNIKKTKRYPNVLQKNEMRKRRLAVVVKVLSDHRVQVVPFTSQDPKGDISTFQLSRETLDNLAFYGRSGLNSWALCNMLQTVSITRIIPPITKKQERHKRTELKPFFRDVRDELYRLKLTAHDRTNLLNTLLKTYSSDDYLELKDIKKKYFALLKEIEEERLINKSRIECLEKFRETCDLYGLDPNKELVG